MAETESPCRCRSKIITSSPRSKPDFNYSAALKSKGGEWTFEDINAFIQNPKAYANGTTMAFAGIAQAGERADILAYLRSLSDSPKPLPTQ
jgi:cytochrome c